MIELNKPVRRVASVREMPHGFRNRLIVTLYPGGIISVREPRHKESVDFDLAKLYASTLVRRALAHKKGR